MKKFFLYCLAITIIMFSVSFSNIISAHAGSKDMVAGKKEKFKDDSVENMRDLMEKSTIESKAYKERMLSNSDQTVALLKEIRDLLQQLNEEDDE